MTGSASKIVIVPHDAAYEAGSEDISRRAPDISKVQRLIGYQPMLDLPEMLERVIPYERRRREFRGPTAPATNRVHVAA